jgi:16S rRNA (cytidine1402-2'-O)-methyltransferase
VRRDRRAGRDAPGAGPAPAAVVAARRGSLFVVATPIGHLDDLSARAIDTLRRCGLIACEDTRVTRGLLHRHAISSTVVSCHRHNEHARTARILTALENGVDVALVSDGGTPGLSDPGAAVVRAARSAGLTIVPIPGPSAVTALWSVSGFPSGPFTVFGFLPHRKGERRRTLESLRDEARPLVFFESPHRILDTLADLRDIMGDRQACLGREMTKIHEEYLSAPLSALHESLAPRALRGEFTLIVAPGPAAAPAPAGAPAGGVRTAVAEPAPDAGPVQDAGQLLASAAAQVLRLTAQGMERHDALRRVARATGVPRRRLYAELVRQRNDTPRHDSEEE